MVQVMKFLKDIARVGPTLITKFYTTFLGAGADFALGSPARGIGSFAAKAFDLLRGNSSAPDFSALFGNFSAVFYVVGRIGYIDLAIAAEKSASALQCPMHPRPPVRQEPEPSGPNVNTREN
jgi:hypothetical protein